MDALARPQPILFARGADGTAAHIGVLVVRPAEEPAPEVIVEEVGDVSGEARLGFEGYGWRAWIYELTLPTAAAAWYRVEGRRYPVATDLSGDLRVAYVSCNGQEHGDPQRSESERNPLWKHLAEQHEQRPFHLILHGGDQLYADEVCDSHAVLREWGSTLPGGRRRLPFEPEVRETVAQWLLEAYLRLAQSHPVAFVNARVPAMMMWDDHDITDGWGSLQQWRLDSPVGKGLFEVASEMFRLFQLGLPVTWSPDNGIAAEPVSFSHSSLFPRLKIVAPDLRSERRPERVMSTPGWQWLTNELQKTPADTHTLLMSSVPVLGPRLSLLERVMEWWPRMQKYEDDLRDQWQSHAHRESWQRVLGLLRDRARCAPVTVLSGEIHVAARGEMLLDEGLVVHQLIASGIAHPAPPTAYAFGLGLLATLGEDPLPGCRLKMQPLPGQPWAYIAQRNYLDLVRRAERWSARWYLEKDGFGPWLGLN